MSVVRVGAAGGQHQDWVYTATGALRPRALAGSCCWLDTLLEPHTPPTLPSYKDDLQFVGENFTPSIIRAFHYLDLDTTVKYLHSSGEGVFL